MSTLERAIEIATEAHFGIKDKGGAPYILHPLRVMRSLSSADERIAAVLHDVCEDCREWPLKRLHEEGFSDDVVAAVDSVTKRQGEDYETFIRRSAANPIGRRVKLADLMDNADISRIANPTADDFQRKEKYLKAIEVLRGMSK